MKQALFNAFVVLPGILVILGVLLLVWLALAIKYKSFRKAGLAMGDITDR